MKHGKYADEDVVCPFYKHQDTYRVSCEGIQKNSSVSLSFALPQERKQHCKEYCNSMDGYHLCPISKMLYKTKYS